jgi:prepilin peptidase CpaA
MEQPFFPNLPFAVVFVLLLAGGLAYAAWRDWKALVVPKWLSLSILGAGVVANVVRGGWMATDGQSVLILAPSNVAVGSLDGLMFALAGFVCGFVLFFVFWIFGMCGGGDVKLVAAVGAWLGPRFVLGAVFLSTPFLVVLVMLTMGYRILGGNLARLPGHTTATGRATPRARRRVTSYSLPFALGAAVILGLLLWGYQMYLTGAAPPQV